MYLNVIQLAESFGVEENVVTGWVRNEGLPAIEDRGRLLFDRAQVVDWAAEHGRATRTGFLAPVPSGACDLESLLRVGGIWRDVAATELSTVFEQAISRLERVAPGVRTILIQRVRAADGITWTPVGGGFALPHLRAHVALGRGSGLLTLLLLREPLMLSEAPADGVPVTRLLFFIAPSPRAHLEMLAQLSTVLTRGPFRQHVIGGAPDEDLFRALRAQAVELPNKKDVQS